MKKRREKRIVILGGGPTGLGAAWRLKELGYSNWDLYEATEVLGGHAGSHKDDKGFVWDEGGHIFFSGIPYFNEFFEKVFKGKYLVKKRIQSILFGDKFVPYPFQNHIRYLPEKVWEECLDGVIEATQKNDKDKAENFLEFNEAVMGRGITKHFMKPYNEKVWSWPLNKMDVSWIAERVSVIDLKKVVDHIINKKDDVLWGPNAFFKYPTWGGTGGFWEYVGAYLKERIHYNKAASMVDIKKKKVYFRDGLSESYDILISTLPINELLKHSNAASAMKKLSGSLRYNSGFVVGVGIKGKPPEFIKNKIGIYFPESKWSFHRATMLWNFSPNTVPKKHWSITFETSYSSWRKITMEEVNRDIMRFLKTFKLIKHSHEIVSLWKKDIQYFYPIPTHDFQKDLAVLQNYLLKNKIFSRGRFGNWKYEIGNMDHSFVLGAEAVNHAVLGKESMFKIYK